MKKFFYYFILPIFQPSKRLDELLNDNKRVKYATLNLLLIGLLYTITIAFGYKNGFGAVVKPFINLPAENYYFYEMFFALPIFLFVVIMFSGCAQLLAKLFGGKGSFDDTYASNGMAYVLPMLITMWLPESTLIIFLPHLRESELGGFNFMPVALDISRQILGIIWPLVITVIGIKKSQQFAWWKAILVTLLAFIPAGLLIIIFIR